MFNHIPDMAARRAEIAPQAIAFDDHDTGSTWTFDRVNRAANGFAAGLVRLGLTKGDRVAILCHNRPEFFVILLGCQKAGVLLCPLNWRQPPAELTETLAPFVPSLIVHDETFSQTAGNVADQLRIKALSLTHLEEWFSAGEGGSVGMIDATVPWYLLFTSGTTGRPKAVIQTAQMAWANAVNIAQAVHLRPSDHSVNFLPLFHTAGINLYTLPVFLWGGRSTVLRKFDAEAALTLLASGRITQFFGVPAIYQAFALSSRNANVEWSTIRCGCGGAPLPEGLIRDFAQRGAKVLNGFGMTETGPTVFLMDEAAAETKIGSVGKAQCLTEVRLDGVAEGPGSGEIQLRGPNITPGYYANPEATATTFTADGWLKTGDIGRRDADGYYYVIDRIKDMYISGGENVYPAEVERVLNTHPDVLEAAVIGVPDAKWGEVGAAFIIARPGHQINIEAVRLWLRGQLAAYKVPATLSVVTDFPRTAAGKVRKPELRTLITA